MFRVEFFDPTLNLSRLSCTSLTGHHQDLSLNACTAAHAAQMGVWDRTLHRREPKRCVACKVVNQGAHACRQAAVLWEQCRNDIRCQTVLGEELN